MKRRNFIKNAAFAGVLINVLDTPSAVASLQFESAFLKMTTQLQSPQFDFFAIDSLGKNNLQTNVILIDETPLQISYTRSVRNNITSYRLASQEPGASPVWEIIKRKSSFSIVSNHYADYVNPFVFNISQYANHATLLGMMKGEKNEVTLPAILHFPDMGTLRVTCNIPGQTVQYSSQRFIEHPFVKIEFPSATKLSSKIEYHFDVVTIHPEINGIENDAIYDCFRKNFISIFQVNPLLKILSNNSASDACAFTLFKYSEVALHAPSLAKGLTARDLIRMTLDRYLAGQKGYGLLGYDYDKQWDIPKSATTCNSLDSYPSLLIAACNYTTGSNDKKWFIENYSKLKVWINEMLSTDSDSDGLLEFCLSGNSGSWKGDPTMRPANWWDTIGFANKDAYSNALAYKALGLLSDVCNNFEMQDDAKLYKARADKLKKVYTNTFYNDTTGILAGWKSSDGNLHDYWFTFVNAIAICYDLIEPSLANSIMDKLFSKMKEVGFTNFELGLPGNLIPVIRADYTDLKPEVGGGKREDNLDGFQIYENGGATACYTYFFIHALQKLGRKKDADSILLPLLKSMSEGNFQGRCSNGRTKDWKTWSGECWGYEGFLV
ncbi:MAG: hypothetical protein ABJA90_11090, partial [Ginsengibacter sp.]